MIEEQYFSDSNPSEDEQQRVQKKPTAISNQAASLQSKSDSIESSTVKNEAITATKKEEPIKLGYMSRAQREKLQKEREEQEKRQADELTQQEKDIREEYERFRLRDWKKEQEREQQKKERDLREFQEQERKRREHARSRSRSRSNSKERHSKYMTSNAHASEKSAIMNSTEDPEIQNIKIAYLGLNKEKKKILKPSEKFKNIFNFKWDSSDDTSVESNPLYKNKVQSNLLFGRGIQAGYDVKEQLERNVKYEDLVHKYDPEYQKKRGFVSSQSTDLAPRRNIYDVSIKDHWSLKRTTEMTERDWRIFREDNDIIIKGGRVPKPMRKWDDGPLPPYIIDSVRRLKYENPTAIQMQTIPIGLERKDLIGISTTGTGKSCAFLIPLIVYLRSLPPMDEEIAKDGPYAIILIPTRELAPQIEKEFHNLTANMRMKSLVMVGGKDEGNQAYKLKMGCELLLGTTGRIRDALQKNYLCLDQVSWVVLDEADKMIDLSFEEDVNFILDRIRTKMKSEDDNMAELQEQEAKAGEKVFRVTHLFSATMPPKLELLAKKYLRSFCYISIGEPGGGKKDIDQIVEFMSEGAKKNKLQSILKNANPPIIIFLNEKNAVEKLAKIIDKWGWTTSVYHGGKTQQQREAAVECFKEGKADILVATDLASRGLHVDGVKMVINFDAPKNIKDFVHRTGRTGRAGKRGTAITFLTNQNEGLFYDLKEFLLTNGINVPTELEQHPASSIKPGTVSENVPRSKQVVFAQ